LREEYNGLKTTINARQSPTAFSELHALLSDHDYMLEKTRAPATSITSSFAVNYADARSSLNIGNLKAFNLVLLQKWHLRLLSRKNVLWVKVIKALHGQEGGFDNNGCIYNGDSPFYIRYNRLYRLEREKDYLIIDRIDHVQWRWNWSRPILGAQDSADFGCIN
ncbi:hypothetical protein Tco_1038850, partial [Tanacetum coccineum]